MNKVIRNFLLCVIAGAGSVSALSAQDIYDDIYYNPKNDKKAANTAAAVRQEPKKYASVTQIPRRVSDYPPADTYQFVTDGVMRDVDEYNRRGIFATDEPAAAATADTLGNFTYTQRIERFHDPDVIVASTDPTLAQVYYAQPVEEVNIYINNPGGYWGGYWGSRWTPAWTWGSSWAWGWTSPSWYWNTWSPYYGYYGWGPSLSWSWGWAGPSWGWGWGGPAWSWGWGNRPPMPPVAGPSHRPNNRHPGAFGRPTTPTPNPGTGVRPGASGQRPGASGTMSQPSAGRHPGSVAGSTVRPGSTSGGFRPGVSTARPSTGVQQRPASGATLRPGAVTTRPASTTTVRPGSNSRPSVTTTRPSSNSYQQSTPTVSRPSSTGGGYRGGSSGGGNRGGGGGGRGRH